MESLRLLLLGTVLLISPSVSARVIDHVEAEIAVFEDVSIEDVQAENTDSHLADVDYSRRLMLEPETVAFTVSLKASIYPHPGQIIVFDSIMTNVGNAYDPVSGHFMAPVSGTYAFFVSIMTELGKDASVFLSKDGKGYGSALVNPTNPRKYETSSFANMITMTAGERVWVQFHGTNAPNPGIHGGSCTLFSGHLIK